MKTNHFEQMAKRYDSEDKMELANIITKEVKTELQNSKSKSLLDYGGGTGLVSLQLTNYVDSILLVDSSEQMLNIADMKIEEQHINNVKVLQADFTEKSPDLKVDIILMSLVLLHIPDTDKILKELFNTLHDDGKLIIVDFDKNSKVSHSKIHSGFAHDEIKRKLLEVGFTSTNIKTFHHGERIFANQDASMFISTSTK